MLFSSQGASCQHLPFIRPVGTSIGGTPVSFDNTTPASLTLNLTEDSAIYLYASATCHVAIDTSPTATANYAPIPAGAPIVLAVKQTDNLSVLGASGSGTLHVILCTNR